MLKLDCATFRYPVRNPRRFRPWSMRLGPGIRSIDLELKAGKILGLVGPNGAGKSTLLQVIAGLLPLEEGTITAEGADSIEARRANIGYMPERVTWSGPGTAKRAIERLCAMRKIPVSEGDELLELVGLGTRVEDDLSTKSHRIKQPISMTTE